MSEMHRLAAAEAFARLGRIKLGETDLTGVLRTIAELAKITVPGADEVSLTLVRATGPATAAFTAELALNLDEVQYARGHGPCLDAATSLETLVTAHTDRATPWPDWAQRARDAGIRSAIAVGLPVEDGVTGALNVYSTGPDAFDEAAVGLAQTFAAYAAVALANAHVYDIQTTLAEQMRAAMESRAIIEQAKGIIMGQRRCSPDEAIKMLIQVSQQSNRKVRDVAAALVARTGAPSGS